MFDTTNNQQSGQSFTLNVTTDQATSETVVSCPAHPEVEPVRDTDSRFAVQEMKRRLDDHVHRGFQTTSRQLMVGPNPDRD
jgi:hypothetical protein